MLTAWEHKFLITQRVARLATVDQAGHPHVVPIVYALVGQYVVTPLDHKPKQVDVLRLQRVRNIQAQPQVALLIDQYTEDWDQLAWLQIRGLAGLIDSGATYSGGLTALAEKYPQYALRPLTGRPLISIQLDTVRSWRGAEPGGGGVR